VFLFYPGAPRAAVNQPLDEQTAYLPPSRQP
jgi:hypothetical protein